MLTPEYRQRLADRQASLTERVKQLDNAILQTDSRLATLKANRQLAQGAAAELAKVLAEEPAAPDATAPA